MLLLGNIVVVTVWQRLAAPLPRVATVQPRLVNRRSPVLRAKFSEKCQNAFHGNKRIWQLGGSGLLAVLVLAAGGEASLVVS